MDTLLARSDILSLCFIFDHSHDHQGIFYAQKYDSSILSKTFVLILPYLPNMVKSYNFFTGTSLLAMFNTFNVATLAIFYTGKRSRHRILTQLVFRMQKF